MKCKVCGGEYQAGSVVCPHCGAPANVVPAVVAVPAKGLGVTALILGIISLLTSCIWFVSIPCALPGLILGCVAKSKAKAVGVKNGAATTGIVFSIISLAFAIIVILLAAAGVMSGVFDSYSYY